jgi:hypothetical protein
MDKPYRNAAMPIAEREVAILQRLREIKQIGTEQTELEEELKSLHTDAHKRRLQILGSVRVASPCPADWALMQGDDTKRYCGICEKHVYNLSAMSEVQAAAFVQTEKQACVRFYQRVDGTVLTQDCPVGVKKRTRRNRVVAAVAAVGVGLTGTAYAMVASDSAVQGVMGSEGTVTMGLVAMPSSEATAPPPEPTQSAEPAKVPAKAQPKAPAKR